MATHTGNEGIVKVGANAVAEVKSFSVTETGDTAEDTCKGDDWRTFKPTFKSWTAEITVQWDETDTTGQGACTIGAAVTVNLYPGGDTTGDMELSGAGIVTERGIESPEDGIVEMSLSIQGNGALTTAAVA